MRQPLHRGAKSGKIHTDQEIDMKKIFTFSVISALCGAASAATPWWQQPTICRLDPTKCYVSMGAGYDTELWDATSGCRGIKIICGAALSPQSDDATPIGRAEISRGAGINTRDYDINILNGDCFGSRKTSSNGTTVSLDGQYVNVWCNGVLGAAGYDVYETLGNGEITRGAQPSCNALADAGYAGIANGRCFGKYYDSAEYFIECGNDLAPSRLVILNGADIGGATSGPATRAEADALFDRMYKKSQEQHSKYFK